jgi:hypothetical protein
LRYGRVPRWGPWRSRASLDRAISLGFYAWLLPDVSGFFVGNRGPRA